MVRKSEIKYRITIKNWDDYQREMQGGEKRKRRRSWVAISVDLFSDPDFFKMDQCHRNAWVGLLCHAGKVGPVFELCPSDARVMFQLRHSPDFEVFKNQGFIDLQAATDKTDKTDKTDSNAPVQQKAARSLQTAKRFNDFWAAYPRKVGKKPCLKKWKARKLDRIADQIIADVKTRVAEDDQWMNGYIPNPQTYLNQDRWEDEVLRSSSPDNMAKERRHREDIASLSELMSIHRIENEPWDKFEARVLKANERRIAATG